MTNTQVAEAKNTLPVNIMDDMYENAGAGTENLTADDMQIPFLRILQPLSPQLLKTDPKYLKGASAGDLFNTVTGDVWDADTGVTIIPCAFQKKYLEFQIRENGGGYVGEHSPNAPEVTKTERVGSSEMMASGNELIVSFQFLVLGMTPNGSFQQMICDMKKTQTKVAKQWNTRRTGLKIMHPTKGLFTPPMWATVWKLKTVQETNDKGSWFNYDVSNLDASAVSPEAMAEAKGLFTKFQKGEIKTQAGTQEEMKEQDKSDLVDDVPF